MDTAPPIEPMRVLVVDDDGPVREVLSAYLSRDGHTVQVAADGAEALQFFRTEPWDMVLTDRAMPQMSGDQLAAEIKAISPDMPVLMVTGYVDAARNAGERSAVDGIVRKPFTLGTLRDAMRTALRRCA